MSRPFSPSHQVLGSVGARTHPSEPILALASYPDNASDDAASSRCVTLGAPYRVPPRACPEKGGGMRTACSRGWRTEGLTALLLLFVACAPGGSSPGPAGPGAGAGASAERPAATEAAASSAAADAPGSIVLAPPEHLRVAYVALSGGYLPLWTALDAGLFQQRGLDVEFAYTGGAQAVQALLAREQDVAVTDGSAVVRAGLASGETVILAVSTNTFAFKLIAGPDVRRPEDLRGRRLGITRAGTTTDFAARYLLRQWGLAPDADVALVQTGGNPEMLATLYAGAIDAAIMSDPNSFQAVKDGYTELLDIGAQGIEYPMFSVATHRALLRERPAALRAFVTAYVDAIAWLERHRPETLAMMARYTQQDNQEVLGATYDLYTSRYLLRVPYPTARGITTILDAVRDSEPRAAETSPSDLIDDRFVRELDESGYIRRLYE
jgi:NitT/TauT family transport system substrate-binding protein